MLQKSRNQGNVDTVIMWFKLYLAVVAGTLEKCCKSSEKTQVYLIPCIQRKIEFFHKNNIIVKFLNNRPIKEKKSFKSDQRFEKNWYQI